MILIAHQVNCLLAVMILFHAKLSLVRNLPFLVISSLNIRKYRIEKKVLDSKEQSFIHLWKAIYIYHLYSCYLYVNLSKIFRIFIKIWSTFAIFWCKFSVFHIFLFNVNITQRNILQSFFMDAIKFLDHKFQIF